MKLNTSRTGLEIAVIGMAGSFPGAADADEFWELLMGGQCGVDRFNDEDLLAAGVHPELLRMSNFVKVKGVFPGIEFFDAPFFDYTPRDAALMDPQVRVLHQCVYHALEDAGYISEQYRGSIGLIAGASGNFGWELNALLDTKESTSAQFATVQLSDKDFVSTRIAYKLNLRGPCVTVYSACSTSLYAVDLACRQLLTGACSMVVAAGSGLSLPHKNGYLYEEGMILSPDGVCRPFSDNSNGTTLGNGMGAVVLKSLENALRDRDRIRAVIRGTSANNDGSRKVGYTAPSVEGQAEVIRRAMHMADVEPVSISYVEAHGTGTALGDPVEIEGLKNAFRSERRGFCGIGSLKSNIGHLDTAAGISSLIKTVLALQHRQLPPSIHFRQPNHQIDFANSPFRVVTAARPWSNPPVEGSPDQVYPLRAGVSSFGIGGTNVHVILEEAPAAAPSLPGRVWHSLCLSAADGPALARLEAALAEHLGRHPDTSAVDLAYTLQVGRRNLRQRSSLAYRSIPELLERLAAGGEAVHRHRVGSGRPQVVFLLPGQGTQYTGMARGLYETEPVFREALERCLVVCDGLGVFQVRELLLNQPPNPTADEDLNRTDLAQPALFAVEYAMARLLMDWGIQPSAMIGHSLGEYVAACLAEVMPLEDAMTLVVERGRLMWGMAPGAMLAVAAAAEDLAGWLPPGVDLAAANGPQQSTVSGPLAAMETFSQVLERRGLQARRLPTSHAFHSASMEPALPAFRRAFAGLHLSPPSIPYVSNVTGTWINPDEAVDPEYYVRHLRDPVRFAEGARTLLAESDTVFVEIGPGTVLSALLRQSAGDRPLALVSALRPARLDQDDSEYLTYALGDLWGQGVVPDWPSYYRRQSRNKVAAPLYPFARHAFPIGRGDLYRLLESAGLSGAQGSGQGQDDLPLAPAWQTGLLPTLDHSTGVKACLALVENPRQEKPLAQVSGLRLVYGRRGGAFRQEAGHRFLLDTARTSDYRRLIRSLKAGDGLPGLIVWLARCRNEDALRALFDRLQRLALVLRSESPGQVCRCLLALPDLDPDAGLAARELDGGLRSLRATCPGFEVRAVLFSGDLPEMERALLLEREIYDADRETLLAAYAKGRRRVYRLLPLALPPTWVGLAGMTLGLVALPDFPVTDLAELLAQVSGARVLPLVLSYQAATARPSPLAIDSDKLRRWLDQAQDLDFRRFGLSDFSRSHALLDEACTSLVARYLDSCLKLVPGHRFTREQLKQAMGVIASLEKYVDYFLAMLVEDGVVEPWGEVYNVLRSPDTLRELSLIKADLVAENSLFTGALQVLEHCVAAYPQALCGQVLPISVIYPGGSNAMLRNSYVGSIQELEEKIVRVVFEEVFRQLIRHAAGRPIRILEVGGGWGMTMRRLAEFLRGVPVEYYFTDIGRSFLDGAKEFALESGLDYHVFGVFDITRSPEEQGLDAHSFDLVVAFDVLHATSSLALSMGTARRLLRDGGLMCMLERIRMRRYIDLIWGLADGWWHFDDAERSRSPLTDLDHWQRVARGAGFGETLCFPDSGKLRRILECGFLIAQVPIGSALASAERWQLAEPPQPVDGVVLVDVCADRPRDGFEPFGDRLIAPCIDSGRFHPSLLAWLARQRPGFVSVWTGGDALCNTPDQMARARVGMDLDRRGRALLGDHAWNRIFLPLVPALPSRALMEQAVRLMQGGLEQAVLAAYRQGLFAPVLPPKTETEATADRSGEAALAFAGEGPEHYEALAHKLWSELFGIARIGLDQDFFELGGDSLKVAQLTSEFEKYGIKLMPNEVFNHPTLRLLARYLFDNRQGEFGTIRTLPALLEHFHQEAGLAACFHSVPYQGRAIRILYLDDAVFVEAGTAEALLSRLHLPPDLQPHHVVPWSRRPASGEAAEAQETWRAMGLAEQEPAKLFAGLTAAVTDGMAALNAGIFAGEVVARYPLSPFQQMFLKQERRATFYLIDFHEPLNRALLDQALTDVVGVQGLMRSRLGRNRLGQARWDEYGPSGQPLVIPLVDLGDCVPDLQAQLVERMMAAENTQSCDRTSGVMYRVMLLRFHRCRYTLLFNLDHSIFDNMSGQVLRRQLLSRYRQLRAGTTAPLEPVKSFRTYLEQLNRGPQGIDKQRLIEIFALEPFRVAKEQVEQRILARRQPRMKAMRYILDLDRYRLADDDDATWEISLAVLCYTLGRFLEQDAIPLKLLFQGRQYQDVSYFDTLGLFIDILPLFVLVDRDHPAAMIEGMRNKVRFANRFNISFMNMLLNLPMRFKWWDVLSPLSPRKLAKRDPMILVNYVGQAEAEYQKVVEFSARQLESGQKDADYASLYITISRLERQVLIDVYCNFEPDMDRLHHLFEEESNCLLRLHEHEHSLGATGDAGQVAMIDLSAVGS